jgi:hypothetical protein
MKQLLNFAHIAFEAGIAAAVFLGPMAFFPLYR